MSVIISASLDDASLQDNVASELTRLAELAVHHEMQCSVGKQFAIADQAIELRKKGLTLEPDIAISRITYA